MTATVSQARNWRPEPLMSLADRWADASGRIQTYADTIDRALADSRQAWQGAAARAADCEITLISKTLHSLSRALVLAASEARDGAHATELARDQVLTTVSTAESEGCSVADEGRVTPSPHAPPLLVLLAGSSQNAAGELLEIRAEHLTLELRSALSDLAHADSTTARAIVAALELSLELSPELGRESASSVHPAATASIVADWPHMSQDSIASQLAAMAPASRTELIRASPHEVGNTDGIPWSMRVQANRLNIANALLAEQSIINRPVEDKLAKAISPALDPASAERLWAVLHADPDMRAAAIASHDRLARQRVALYESLLADTADPTEPSNRIPRQILAFDPARESLIELSGDLATARAVGVLVPGLNTTWETSNDDVATARQFVSGSYGQAAMITYLGGQFPTGELASGLFSAANPRYALDMAPRLVAFSEDVNRTVDGLGKPVPVTYIGHSYGGSIVGTAERFGLTADRVIYAEAAGAGVGVRSPEDWHNRNPDVRRFAITAPGDWISLVQGLPFGPHGADPDEMAGVIQLQAGRRLNGWPMIGPTTHSDVINEPSDAWRNILAVVLGDSQNVRTN